MAAKLKALAWELWHPNRWGIIGMMLVAPAAVWLLQRAAPETIQAGPVEGAIVLLFMWGLLFLGVIFSYAEFSPKNFQVGFPNHVLRLPVRTSALAGVPLLLGVSSLLAYLLIWSRIDALAIPWRPGIGVVLVVIAVSWVQAINWGLGRTPAASATAMIGVSALTVICLLTVTAGPDDPVLLARGTAWSCLALLAFAGVALAQWSVARTRRGQVIAGFERTPSWRLPGFSIPRRLRSAAHAQFRYEWRVFGWILPTCAAAMGILVFFVQFLNPEDTIEATVVVLMMFFYVACALGLEIGKSHFRRSDYRMSGFWATRPLSSRSLANAKLKLAAMTIFVGTLLILLPALAAWHLSGSWEQISAAWQAFAVREGRVGALAAATAAVALLPLLAWIACANTMAACMSGHRWLSQKLIMAVGPVLVVVAFGGYQLFQMPAFRLFLREHTLWLALLPIAAAIGLVVLLGRRFELSRGALIHAPSVAPAITILALGAVAAWSLSFLADHRIAVLAVTFNLTLFAWLPFVTAPVALSANRHRG
ncbi:MAG: hypothetical protein AAGA95_01490 [Pseudomonadota bacterium]